jgi:hypothetical protein
MVATTTCSRSRTPPPAKPKVIEAKRTETAARSETATSKTDTKQTAAPKVDAKQAASHPRSPTPRLRRPRLRPPPRMRWWPGQRRSYSRTRSTAALGRRSNTTSRSHNSKPSCPAKAGDRVFPDLWIYGSSAACWIIHLPPSLKLRRA